MRHDSHAGMFPIFESGMASFDSRHVEVGSPSVRHDPHAGMYPIFEYGCGGLVPVVLMQKSDRGAQGALFSPSQCFQFKVYLLCRI